MLLFFQHYYNVVLGLMSHSICGTRPNGNLKFKGKDSRHILNWVRRTPINCLVYMLRRDSDTICDEP